MQRQINLKIIVSVSILVLIIGLIDTAKVKHETALADDITAEILNDHPRVIDSSFFQSDTQAPSAPVKVSLAPIASPKAILIPSVQPQAPADVITADSYLVANLATGKVYFSKNADAVWPIASISKLVTAIVVEKNFDPNENIAISSSSVTGYEQTGDVHPNETFSAKDLLTGMLLISSNDAALAFANEHNYPAFISLMNQTVRSLGMSKTAFEDPSGLSPYNVSSANDLFRLAQHLYADEEPVLAITKMPSFDLATTTEHGGHDFINIDPFPYDPHYIGGKTGRSGPAGETMLSLFNLPINGIDNPIAIIVLHSDQDSRQTDSSILVGKVLNMISSQ